MEGGAGMGRQVLSLLGGQGWWTVHDRQDFLPDHLGRHALFSGYLSLLTYACAHVHARAWPTSACFVHFFLLPCFVVAFQGCQEMPLTRTAMPARCGIASVADAWRLWGVEDTVFWASHGWCYDIFGRESRQHENWQICFWQM